jgi:hypothetical protein
MKMETIPKEGIWGEARGEERGRDERGERESECFIF